MKINQFIAIYYIVVCPDCGHQQTVKTLPTQKGTLDVPCVNCESYFPLKLYSQTL